MSKKIISVALCMALVLSLCACGGIRGQDPTNASDPTEKSSEQPPDTTASTTQPTTETTTEPTTLALSIGISVPNKHIELGKTSNVAIKLNKEDTTPVVWSSSNNEIISVDATGVVTTKALGTATITAKIGETVSNELTLTSETFATAVNMATPEIVVIVGERSPIGAAPLPETATDKDLSWECSDSSIAKIDGTNVVGKTVGTCTFTVKNCQGTALGTCTVTVQPKPSRRAEYNNQIVQFQTKYDASNKNRSANLLVSSKAIDNTVLQPGAQFSFNETVGKRTPERGYKEAIVFNAGKEEKGLGGGICQVSSTLFNAALLANFRIDARSCHSLKVHYVPLGRDAAIQWGAQDLKFTNTLDVPIYIESDCADGVLTFRIYTPGDAPYTLPSIQLNSGGSGSKYWMNRTVNEVVDYSANSVYGN